MAGWDEDVGAGSVATLAAPATTTIPFRVAVLVPHRDEYDYRMWARWFLKDFIMPDGSWFLEQRGFSLTTNRTRLVELALEQKECTHVFFLDDDVICPPNIITDLGKLNVPIACGLYRAKKKLGERGLAAWMGIEQQGRRGYVSIDEKQAGRLIACDVTGLGCALIKREVFERISKPWFQWDTPPAPSEDFYFFEKVCREMNGVKPVIDMEQKCQHIGVFMLGCDDQVSTPMI